jgi:glycosyltransferase involved in cell wall biosynthesis
MKISVALCTYNGSRFLAEQLESIAGQTRIPDELIICDDHSSDDSADIAGKFADAAPFPVKIIINETNLGSTSNFSQAIESCSGDVIALSDQDDVWLPHKLARIESECDAADVGLVFSNATLTDEQLKPIGMTLWREVFRPHDRRIFAAGNARTVLLQYNVVTGATMAFRSTLRPAILPIPELYEFIHDAWIALVASLSSTVRMVPTPLIEYRQHSAQQLGAGLSRWTIPRIEHHRMRIDDRKAARERIEDFRRIFDEEWLEQLRSVAPDPGTVPSISEMQVLLDAAKLSIGQNIKHNTARAELPLVRPLRVPKIFNEYTTGRYGKYSRGWQSAVLDLVRK